MRSLQLTFFLALAALAHAAPGLSDREIEELKFDDRLKERSIGGRCSANGSPNGICISTSSCASYGGTSDPGGPGAWTCPGTPDDVQCCSIIPHCPGKGSDTLCTWRNYCDSWWTGNAVVLPDAICPGGNDFVCCDVNG